MSKLLEVENLHKIYSAGEAKTHALRGINYTFFDHRFYAIVGKSGSGKSTLLHIISGMESPTEGSVSYRSVKINNMRDAEISKMKRQKFGFVFQAYHLLPELCVLENILLPADLNKQKADKAYVNEILKTLGLQDKIRKYPSQLSGGEQQRVAIARALINKPEVIFADEPTGNLDQQNGRAVIDLFVKLQKRFQQTIILVTHDKDVAACADEIICIRDGRIAAK